MNTDGRKEKKVSQKSRREEKEEVAEKSGVVGGD